MPAKSQEVLDSMEAYRLLHPRCAMCYWDGRGYAPLEVHHIVGRRGKGCHHEKNLLVLCRCCHDFYHSTPGPNTLTLGHMLTAKLEEDGEVDVAYLAALKNRVGLHEDPLPLPDWVEADRLDNVKPLKKRYWSKHE